jgi:hypothetical protein
MLDPESRVLELLELGDDGRYVHTRSVSEGQVQVTGFEGLTLDLDALWTEVEESLSDESEAGVESGEGATL